MRRSVFAQEVCLGMVRLAEQYQSEEGCVGTVSEREAAGGLVLLCLGSSPSSPCSSSSPGLGCPGRIVVVGGVPTPTRSPRLNGVRPSVTVSGHDFWGRFPKKYELAIIFMKSKKFHKIPTFPHCSQKAGKVAHVPPRRRPCPKCL